MDPQEQKARELHERAMAIIEDEWRGAGVSEDEVERRRRARRVFDRFVEVGRTPEHFGKPERNRALLRFTTPDGDRVAYLDQVLPDAGQLTLRDWTDLLERLVAEAPEDATVELIWERSDRAEPERIITSLRMAT